MSITVTERRVEDTVVFDIAGRMQVEEGQNAILNNLRQNLDDGHRTFLLNLRDVPAADTSGIAELVQSLQLVDQHGGNLGLVGLQPHVRRLLQVSGLLKVFLTFPDEESALVDLKRRRTL